MEFIAQLVRLGEIWSETNGRSLARLSTIVANNGQLFTQISKPGATCTVATYAKFLSFFRDGANWPDGRIPHAATELLDNFANIATEQETDSLAPEVTSAGNSAENSPCAVVGRGAL